MIKETTALVTISYWQTILAIPFVGGILEVMGYLYLNELLISSLLALMFLDFLTAGYAKSRLEIPFSFRRFKNGIYTKVMVFVVIISLGIVVKALEEVSPSTVKYLDMTAYISGIITYLIFAEFISILSNIQNGRNKTKNKKVDLFAFVLKKITDKVMPIVENRGIEE